MSLKVLVDYGYVWDSSAAVPPTKVPIWPYTLDYAIVHECRSGTCPTRSFPGQLLCLTFTFSAQKYKTLIWIGVWEFPLNSHFTESFEGGFCPYMDQCVLQNMDETDVLEWLKEDFSRYYDGNRAVILLETI